MDKNPYQAPQSQPAARPSGKALIALSLLSVLSVPASAIAGSATCTGLMGSSNSLIGVPIGVICCLAIVVGTLVFEEWYKTGILWPQIRPALVAVLYFQAAAVPVAITLAFLGGIVGYAALVSSNGRNEWLVTLTLGSVVNLAWSSAAYSAWRHWFQTKSRENAEIMN